MRSLLASLPVEARNELELRPRSAIRLVVVHWDGSEVPFGEGYDPATVYAREARAHIGKDWGGGSYGYGLMYHERVSRVGQVWLTRPAEHVVWACRGANSISYNVCVDAGPEWDPTHAQVAVLGGRVEQLRTGLGLPRSAVWGHGELLQYGNQTECPGDYLTEWCRRYRRGEV